MIAVGLPKHSPASQSPSSKGMHVHSTKMVEVHVPKQRAAALAQWLPTQADLCVKATCARQEGAKADGVLVVQACGRELSIPSARECL